jgi:hypothetical protein
MKRKWVGKICRHGQIRRRRDPGKSLSANIIQLIQYDAWAGGLARRSHG